MNLNRIMRIFDEQGNWFEGDKIPDQFIKHFEKFSSNEGETDQIDAEGLFNKKLTAKEADFMVREVTDKEVKDAMFGIEDDKAPGPDGFTAKFFKKSWDIVGKDVYEAVKDFFKTNKLLGEVNATVITLIPKVQHPNKVSEYRPITCCNELLKGYNRKLGPSRCALKIDIAKAYDTVNWRYGYFKSGMGLRQGDPMSPYLFTLVMEVLTLMVQRRVENNNHFRYHWGCKEIKLTQLCFVDDLLMLSKGDYKSMEVLKEGLMEFSKTSGLVPNMNKSIIFFGSVKDIERKRILEVMSFNVGNPPMKYLGVPLITRNNEISELKEIEKALKGLLWCQRELKRGAAKVAWKVICGPKSQGCLGIKSLGPWNEALLCKHLWNIIDKKDSLWVKWVNMVKLKGKSLWEIEIEDNDSGTWKAILNLRSKLRDSVWKKIRDGKSTNIWFDKWCDEGPLNVAKLEEPLMNCEWRYNLHNDALSCLDYAIVDDG
nr:hypothetical protein [Tanacetum cinerariifolium]